MEWLVGDSIEEEGLFKWLSHAQSLCRVPEQVDESGCYRYRGHRAGDD